MARGKTNKLYRTFVKGMITEAGYLTYPENASMDELNMVLKKKGSRSRRFGLEYEPNSLPYVNTNIGSTDTVSEYMWKSVNNDADLNFIVVQFDNNIIFFDTSFDPLAAGVKGFSINLLTYKSPTATNTQVQNTFVQMTSGKGLLFIAQQFIEPLVVEYDADTDTISVVPVIIQIRDFDGLDDGLANDEEPTTLSVEHLYNLRNQGWISPGTTAVGPSGSTPVPPPPPSGNRGFYNPFTGEFNTVIP